MRWRTIALACGGLTFLLSLPAAASIRHSVTSHRGISYTAAARGIGIGGGNCVAYAKAVTGIKIDGNAGLWWSHAAGRYDRGQAPKIGSILVFKSSGHMRSGHVAVVSAVVASRKILVDHANWERGRVSKAMAVVDVSPANDWTSVKVLGNRPETGGQRDNPTFGFIYPHAGPDDVADAKPEPRDERHASDGIVHAHLRPHRERLQIADARPVPVRLDVAAKTTDNAPIHKHRAEPH